MARMTWLNEVTGSDAWWQQQQQQGIPLIEPGEEGTCQVTFFWRDPHGDESHSAIRRVWINITGVTDHHQSAAPSSLTRVPHTDVWWWQTTLPADWRGSYCLIPDRQAEKFDGQTDMQTLRQWWSGKFPSAQADPLNPLRGWAGGRGMRVSPLHLPQAPDQSVWHDVDRGQPAAIPLQPLLWRSERLGNQRTVWLYCSGEASSAARPLALLLDGQFWAQTMPIAGPLQQLTAAGELPPAVYAMIDIIDREHRSRELTCNPEFWLAVQHELLPLIQQTVACRVQGDSTLVAGQSFGGLSAAYATLSWPETFGAAISLSGSFWWPARGNPNGWLPQQLQQGLLQAPPRRFYLEAGRRERLILAANQQFERDLIAAGHQVSYQPFEGGHDALCWRGGLLAGLKAMWQYP
ncbi:MAG: enterochelin esterase [Pantoea sp.]|uniref:Enterobactin/ferric enterobactin esterase n=1 Tax=Pantoea brenneri TaxID=472694 RepID=A0AAX3J2Z7_9GAMM|nr:MULTISPECIES: enterochelin esterase [Pantoea]MBS6033482.1 enterochelin esterase [Pantoea sp.]MDH2122261.1 enterochelin esterase [Pantoea brenneri]VXB30883.1 enterobactin/ferric enterobactin esterase [Pantoea brenneri]